MTRILSLFKFLKRVGFAVLFLVSAKSFAQWSEPVLVDAHEDSVGINTWRREWCPFVSADGNYFYFTRTSINNDIFVCHRTDSGWSEPQMLPFCQELLDERNPSTNATNDTLYFVSWAPGWDIFWSFRTGPEDTAWSQPERLPEPINSTGIEFAVWATPDNSRLLFVSWRIGANAEDIYECRRDPESPTGWSVPVLLPGHINSGNAGYPESYPTMSLDTTEIFFWGRSSRLYVSQLEGSLWGRPDSLPDYINRVIINSPTEITPCITSDGSRLYFSSLWESDSTISAGDIWYTERPVSVESGNGQSVYLPELHIDLYPNPFNSTLRISLEVPFHSDVNVLLYDLLGREVGVIYRGRLSSSMISYAAPAGLGSGVYFLRASAASQSVMRKVVLLK